MSDRDLLAVQFRTIFVTDAAGRIVKSNDPDRSPGPLLWLGGSKDGNVFGMHADLADAAAQALLTLAADEPPFAPPNDTPRHLDRYLALLTRDSVVPRYIPGVIYELGKGLTGSSGVTTVDSESTDGKALTDWIAANGMPDGLREMGFHDESEFWAPWCAALFFGQPVAVCFASRLSEHGAEAGVATARNFRGRGFAAAATAGWSRIKSLQSRSLFYSTDRTNRSSQRVAARLGLRHIGNRMTLA